ncbi:FliM/FliN family flagellar motor switch protein [Yoonia sp. R2331]|uniref:FliM/FliN family flagellar motor switch protein n=1 Tax=Yoonia sp. R2331 TaxID=3237238 RepID=UPI0034E3E484
MDETEAAIAETPTAKSGGSSLLQKIPIEITISVGKARPAIQELLELGQNAVLPLDRRIDDPVELYVGDRLIARGELQELEGGEHGQLAVRLTEVISDTRDLA